MFEAGNNFINPLALAVDCHFEPEAMFSPPPGHLQYTAFFAFLEVPMDATRIFGERAFQGEGEIFG